MKITTNTINNDNSIKQFINNPMALKNIEKQIHENPDNHCFQNFYNNFFLYYKSFINIDTLSKATKSFLSIFHDCSNDNINHTLSEVESKVKENDTFFKDFLFIVINHILDQSKIKEKYKQITQSTNESIDISDINCQDVNSSYHVLFDTNCLFIFQKTYNESVPDFANEKNILKKKLKNDQSKIFIVYSDDDTQQFIPKIKFQYFPFQTLHCFLAENNDQDKTQLDLKITKPSNVENLMGKSALTFSKRSIQTEKQEKGNPNDKSNENSNPYKKGSFSEALYFFQNRIKEQSNKEKSIPDKTSSMAKKQILNENYNNINEKSKIDISDKSNKYDQSYWNQQLVFFKSKITNESYNKNSKQNEKSDIIYQRTNHVKPPNVSNDENFKMSKEDKLVIILEILNALKVLYENNISHLNLSSSSIFLNSRMDAYIGNFIRYYEREQNLSKFYHNCYFRHPDLLADINRINENTTDENNYFLYDIYSFGVLIYVIITEKIPEKLFGNDTRDKRFSIIKDHNAYINFLFKNFNDCTNMNDNNGQITQSFDEKFGIQGIRSIIEKCMKGEFSSFENIIKDFQLLVEKNNMKEIVEYRIKTALSGEQYKCTLTDLVFSYYMGNNISKNIIEKMFTKLQQKYSYKEGINFLDKDDLLTAILKFFDLGTVNCIDENILYEDLYDAIIRENVFSNIKPEESLDLNDNQKKIDAIIS